MTPRNWRRSVVAAFVRAPLACLLIALPAVAQVATVSTFSAWDGRTTAQPFGVPSFFASDTYGQTFTVPASSPYISNVSFSVGWNSGGTLSFSGYLMAWNGTAATGPVLFQSAPSRVDSGSAGIQRIDFPISGVTLKPGSRYVFFLLASSASSGQATGVFAVTGDSTSYAGGNFVFTDSGGVFSNLSEVWRQADGASSYGDAAFEADFSSSPVAAQTISFVPAVTSYTLSAGSFEVTAAATSQLSVVFTTVTPAVCTVSQSTVTITSAGQCTIKASQPGSTTFAPAPSVSATFTITATALPTPVISKVTPNTEPAGSPETVIAITGQNLAGSTVTWTTPDRRTVTLTALAQAAQIAATVPATLLSTIGTAQLAVANPQGVLSNAVPFSITGAVATTISSLSPNQAVAGDPSTRIVIAGQNIAPNSRVSWTSPGGTSVSISPGLVLAAQVSATIPAALLSTSGAAQIALSDPNGLLSNRLLFSISAPVSIAAATLGRGRVGQFYVQAPLQASGGTPPYKWTVTTGSLPPQVSLDPKTGTLSGTPSRPGTYLFGVRATDAGGAIASSPMSIAVDPAPLRIITPGTTFQVGAGLPFPTQIITATGGVGPYTFSYSGTLPSGLTFLQGALSGTPDANAPGTYTILLIVTDALASTAAAQEIIRVVRPVVDLSLSQTSASFTLASGSGTLPPPVSISVGSVNTSLSLSYTATASDSWFRVTSGTGTPGTILIQLSAATLFLGSPPPAHVTVTCTSAVCAGNGTQNIDVVLNITSPPPQLTASSFFLSFTGTSGSPQKPSQLLTLSNSGGGSFKITSITAADSYVTVGTPPAGPLAGGSSAAVTITVDPTGLSAGFYRSSVDVVTDLGGSETIPVTLLLVPAPMMTLAPAGSQLGLPQGGALGNSNGSFQVAIGSASSVAYSIQVSEGAGGSWLKLTSAATGSATSSQPGTVNYAIDPIAAAGLSIGTYYGNIVVTSPGAANSPLVFQVVLTVTPAASSVRPDPQPAGVLFLTTAGGASPPSQGVSVFAASTSPQPYSVSADGQAWLSVSPKSGTASATTPGASTVAVNVSGLSAGVYRGAVTYQISTATRAVNVTLVVAPAPASAGGSSRPGPLGAGCAPSTVVPAPVGLAGNFSVLTSWPTQISVQLYDDCGAPVTNGQALATFSNGDDSIPLSLIDPATGLYSGTWTPRNPSQQATVTITAAGPNIATGTTQISGQVQDNPAAPPSIAPNSIGNIFNPLIGGALAPGAVVQIYGSGLATQSTIPSTLPLPTSAGGTSVLIGGIPAPLFYAGPGQINAQVPFELAAGKQYQVIVNANGALSTPASIALSAAAPGILADYSGQAYAQRADGSFVSGSAPAQPGEYLVLYVLGMGLTDNPKVVSGAVAPSSPLANALASPALTVGGAPAKIIFAGLTPGFAGLYQVNFQVPTDARTGNQELVLTQAGAAANAVLLPVQAP